MIPFYADNHVTIYHADFREWAGRLDVDAVVTDPPYEETGLAWDKWPASWPGWLLSHVRPTTSLWCFGSLRMFMDHAGEFAGWKLAQDIVWEKPNGSSLHADRFRRVHEVAGHYYPAGTAWRDVFKAPVIRRVEERQKRRPIERQGKPAHWGELERKGAIYAYDGTRLARSVMFAPAVRQGVRHGTPKPLSILRDLITYSTPSGGGVADLMCGSGSTLVAAKEIGRRAIGFDVDRAAVEEAAERCSQTLGLA